MRMRIGIGAYWLLLAPIREEDAGSYLRHKWGKPGRRRTQSWGRKRSWYRGHRMPLGGRKRKTQVLV